MSVWICRSTSHSVCLNLSSIFPGPFDLSSRVWCLSKWYQPLLSCLNQKPHHRLHFPWALSSLPSLPITEFCWFLPAKYWKCLSSHCHCLPLERAGIFSLLDSSESLLVDFWVSSVEWLSTHWLERLCKITLFKDILYPIERKPHDLVPINFPPCSCSGSCLV